MRKYFFLIVTFITLWGCKNEKDQVRHSSAQPNVTVLPQKFKIKGLDRDRQIRIFLPQNYAASNNRYPVLYMHDGQNVFDDSTSYAGEWGVDEHLNELAAKKGFEIIVVAVDNGQEKRMNELSPWENKDFGKAEGNEYMEFIVKDVKPFIDSTYRTITDRDNTAIMGSSMGGLISHYAICRYPEVFGKAGIFSPSYWFSKEVYDFVTDHPLPNNSRLFMLVGAKESSTGEMVDGSQKMYDTLVAHGFPKDHIKFIIDKDGEHNEAFWRRNFVPAIEWLFVERFQ